MRFDDGVESGFFSSATSALDTQKQNAAKLDAGIKDPARRAWP